MMKSLYLTLALLCSFQLHLNAQSGYLDLSFSEDGILIPDMGTPASEVLYESALQVDGRIVLAGVAGGDFAVMRLLPDGTSDNTFGTNGIVLKDYNGPSDRGHAVLIQPDGRIVIAGQTQQNNNGDFLVLRLMPDGSPDSTFGINGWVITDLGTTFEFPNCAALQADGKILVAGRRTDPVFSEFAMVRYHPDGRLDSLFGNNGIVATNLRDEDEATAIAIEPDGQIILAGYASVSASGDFALTHYNTDGTLDKFFGEGGKVLTDLEGFNASDFIRDMVLLPDGKILVAGNANNSNFEGTSDAGLVRYDANGILDPEFGTGGIYIGTFGPKTDINGMAVQPDGKILLGGTSNLTGDDGTWILGRFHANGTLDTGFGNAGITSTDMIGTNEAALTVLIQPDSRVIMTGYSGINFEANFTIARYIADFILSYTATDITCHGDHDGSITVNASGGVEPYGYSIDGINFQSENTFTDLPPGTYTITIKDSNGPGVTGSIGPITLIAPPAPPLVDIIDESDANWITINVEGNADGFIYSIDGGITFQQENEFFNLHDGIYFVVVQDANGCVIHTEQVLISTLGIATLRNTLAFNLSPNPTTGPLRIETNNASGDEMILKIMDMTGRLVYTFKINESGPVIRKLDFHLLDSGVYQVWVGNETISGVKKVVITQ